MKRASMFGASLVVAGLALLGMSGAASFARPAGGGPDAPPPDRNPGLMIMRLADTNHDHYVSTNELIAFCNRQFSQMDRAHRGSIGLDGLDMRIQGKEPDWRLGPGRSREVMFHAMDYNNDGRVSRMEYIAWYLQKMATADRDANSRLSTDEIAHLGGPGPKPWRDGPPRGDMPPPQPPMH